MGIRRLGCLLLIAALLVLGWLTRGHWMTGGDERAATTTSGPRWEPLTRDGGERARQALLRLSAGSGRSFENLGAGDAASYVFQQLARQLPPSADSVEAAVIGDRLFLRASVKLSDLGGATTLGPLAAMMGERERMQFGGTFRVIRPGLSEFAVKEIRVRELNIPPRMIPRLLRQIERGSRPAGLSEDGLPLETPRYLGDVRVANGKVTLYKSGPEGR